MTLRPEPSVSVIPVTTDHGPITIEGTYLSDEVEVTIAETTITMTATQAQRIATGLRFVAELVRWPLPNRGETQ